MLKQYFQLDLRIVLTILILVEFLYQWILQHYFVTDQVIYQSFITDLTDEQFFQGQQKASALSWLLFLFIPFTVLLSITLAAWCLNLGNLLLEKPIQFRTLFAICARAYIVFSLARVIALFVYSYYGVETVLDLQFMPSFSLFDLWPKESLPNGLSYPLKLINIFQLAFLAGLAYGLHLARQTPVHQWFMFAIKTYGSALLVWIILTVFLAFV